MLNTLRKRAVAEKLIGLLDLFGGQQLSSSWRHSSECSLINTSLQRGAFNARSAEPLQRFFYSGAKPLKWFKELSMVFATPLKRGVNEIPLVLGIVLLSASSSLATTKGLSQIVTPDLQGEGDLSLSLQIQDKRIANPYELQAELAGGRGSIAQSANSRQAHREPLLAASRTWPDKMGGGCSLPRF